MTWPQCTPRYPDKKIRLVFIFFSFTTHDGKTEKVREEKQGPKTETTKLPGSKKNKQTNSKSGAKGRDI